MTSLPPANEQASIEHTNGQFIRSRESDRSDRKEASQWHIEAVESNTEDSSAEASSLSEEAITSYDDLRPDPFAMIEGSRGAGLELDEYTMGRIIPGTVRAHVQSAGSPGSPQMRKRRNSKRNSIQLVVDHGDKKGRYILTADDPEIRDIIRKSLKRETVEKGAQKYFSGFRELVFTRRFTTFDRQNPLSSGSPFHGFFTLFWLGMGLLLTKVAAQNWRSYGSVFGKAELLRMMFERDIIILGLTDGAMVGSTIFGLGLQKLVLNGYLSWTRTGWIMQNLWQTAYLFSTIAWTWYREWPWTHTIFIVLHCLVFIMKQHSYAFYNGYLSQVYRRRRILQRKLEQLNNIVSSASPISLTQVRTVPSTTLTEAHSPERLSRRRHSVASKSSTNLEAEQSDIAKIAAAIDSGEPLDEDQMAAFGHVIRLEMESLTKELNGKSIDGINAYPKNLTIANWADWTCLPTLVYELEYPRQEKINWWYVAEKTAATFGVIWVMMVVSQAYIYPAVVETVRMKEAGMTLEQRWLEFPWIMSDMLFPLLLEQLLSWYVIWECCLNVLAEVTRFADRGFYGDWWNSTSWDQYARDWNRPVHSFLLRHVYHSSISAFHLSKGTATFATFFLSACVHELLMYCIFKKVRGYLFAMQLAQLPLAALSRTKLMKGRDTLGNILFWFGLFVGPSILTSLYLIV